MLKNFKKALGRLVTRIRKKSDDFLSRRPHRSFRRTRRRDYARPLQLPGLFAFNAYVTRTLWGQRRLFVPLFVVYIILFGLLVGVGSQETYGQLKDFFAQGGAEILGGSIDALTQAGVTIAALATNGLSGELTEAQQIFGVLLGVLAWLTIVWILRNTLAGHKITMRDGLYNAGAPLIATIVIVLVIALQLIPVALAAVGYSAAYASGLIAGGGVPAMLFWSAAVLLGLVSLYWITSSLFALVIITLPGMYPYRALRTAGDMVLGRRVAIVGRWVWMGVSAAVLWVAIMLPMILLDMGLKALWPAIDGLPIVPVALVVAGGAVLFWASTYIYLFYRKVVDNESV